MKIIYKYPIENVSNGARNIIPMQKGAKVLDIEYQGTQLTIWALVEKDAPMEDNEFLIFSTGHAEPMFDNPNLVYMSSAQHHTHFWHIFKLEKS
jgi:hypothetical protein